MISAIEAFAEAVRRSSKMMYDNLGIRIDVRSLRTWPEFRDARDRLYGNGWIGRFWCKRVRPRLMPQKQREYQAIYDIANTAHKVEYMAEVLKRGKELGYT